MRTMVDPAATAASRSALIPIDRSSRPSASARRPTERKAAAAASASGGATVISPSSCRSSVESDPARAATSAGAQPLRPGRPPVVSTWIRTRAPGCVLRDALSLGEPGHALPHVDQWRQRPHLVALDRAQKVPLRPGRPGRLGLQLGGVVLPDIGQSRRPGRLDRLGPEPLGHREHPHPGRIASGALDAGQHSRQASRDFVVTEGRRARRNRRHPGRTRLLCSRSRRRCRRCRPGRGRGTGPDHCSRDAHPPPSARIRPR